MKLYYVPLALSFAFAGVASAADSATDNTKQNQNDADRGTVTTTHQGESKDDIAITKAIRHKVMKENLSSMAKNVKIIAADGVVTLRGTVKTEEEKDTIANDAQSVAGVKRVDNQLEVSAE